MILKNRILIDQVKDIFSATDIEDLDQLSSHGMLRLTNKHQPLVGNINAIYYPGLSNENTYYKEVYLKAFKTMVKK